MPSQTPIPTQINIAPSGMTWKNWKLVQGTDGFPTRETMEKYLCNPDRVRDLEECRDLNHRTIKQLEALIQLYEAQMEAVGAGGVEPLRKCNKLHQIAEPAVARREAFEAWARSYGTWEVQRDDRQELGLTGYTDVNLTIAWHAVQSEAAAPQAAQAAHVMQEELAQLGYQFNDGRMLPPEHVGELLSVVQSAPCCCQFGTCETKADRQCRMKSEIAATHPTQQGLDALTQAARDVLAERHRQIEAEGWKSERDDVYDTGEMALAAACYAAHSASCAAILAPHSARGVFVRTRSAQDFVKEMWPWAADWWKPAGQRRNLEKAGALILAEIERIDRAALAAQAKQGGAQP